MATFWGHVDEGVFFIILALWWMMHCFINLIWQQSGGPPFISTWSYVLPGKRRIPVEIYYKIFFPIIGFILEWTHSGGVSFVDKDGNFIELEQMQHMTFFTIVVLHAITDLLLHHGFPLMPGTQYLTVALAFFWCGLAFYFHSHMHGKEPLEVAVHLLFIPLLVALGFTTLLEMKVKAGGALMLIRIFLMLTLGTWFCQVAYLLYDGSAFPGKGRSSFDRKDHRNVAFSIAAFGIHLCCNLFFMIVSYVLTYAVMRRKYGMRIARITNDAPTLEDVHEFEYRKVGMEDE